MTQLLQFTAGAIWLATLSLALFGWLQYLRYRKIGSVSLPYECRNPVPWGLVHLIVIVLLFVFGQFLAGAIGFAVWGEESIEDSPIVWIGLAQLGLLATWLVVMFTMLPRCQSPTDDLGLALIPRDIVLGIFTFAMLVIPLFALQWCLSRFSEKQHPLIESLLEDSGGMFFVVGGFAAVIVAPIVEEFLFRVFLQGWLENLAAYRQAVRVGREFPPGFGVDLFWGRAHAYHRPQPSSTEDGLLTGDREDVAEISSNTEIDTPPPSVSANHPPNGLTNPYSSPSASLGFHVDSSGSHLPMRPASWPILVSAGAFAAAHIGHGPDPIPLFFLALALGVLYQRTHRVWPCITVHCLLNFVSLFNLWVIVNTPELADQLL